MKSLRSIKDLGALALAGLGIIGTLGLGHGCNQYADNWFIAWDKDYQLGKRKNATTAIVAAEVANKAYDGGVIDLELQRTNWVNGTVEGVVNLSKGSVTVDDGKAVYYYTEDVDVLKGKVAKNELDWHITREDDGRLKVGRWGPKFNRFIEVYAQNGVIDGKVDVRGVVAFDWDISGTYDQEGNVKVKMDIPFGLDVNLEGRIIQ